MNKPQICLAATGGVVAVAALVLGWFIFSARTAGDERADELEENLDSGRRILTKLPVRPVASELKVFASNTTAYVDWLAEARKVASAGDTVFDPMTSPAFKTRLVTEARRLSSLPGKAEGRLVKKDFPFGFKDYIVGGVLPDAKDVMRLQREWFDVSSMIRLLAGFGADEILDVRLEAKQVVEQTETANTGKKNKKRKAQKVAAADKAPKQDTMVTRFTIDFLARPEVFVEAVNACATNQRFTVVERFSFARVQDRFAEVLGGEKQGEQRSSRRSRRARAVAEEKDVKKDGTVFDPAKAPPLKVSMTFAVYDFRSLESNPSEEESKEAK